MWFSFKCNGVYGNHNGYTKLKFTNLFFISNAVHAYTNILHTQKLYLSQNFHRYTSDTEIPKVTHTKSSIQRNTYHAMFENWQQRLIEDLPQNNHLPFPESAEFVQAPAKKIKIQLTIQAVP